MSVHPDWIEVQETQTVRQNADRVDISLTIRGATSAGDDAGAQKTQELRRLIADLKQIGLDHVKIHVPSGVLNRTPSSLFNFKIAEVEVARLTDVFGVITSHKSMSLNGVEWRYPYDTPVRDELLRKCLLRANEKSRSMAAALGVKVVGIYELSQKRPDFDGAAEVNLDGTFALLRESSNLDDSQNEGLDLEVLNSREISASVIVKFRVSEPQPLS